jgi:hypothetical protein
MKKDTRYALEYLHGVPYLLPFGQNMVRQRPGYRLNEAGAFLWTALDTAEDRTALETAWLRHTGAGPADREAALGDLAEYLAALERRDLLRREDREEAPLFARLAMGPLALELRGAAEYFSPQLTAYAGAGEDLPRQTVTVTEAPVPDRAGAEYVLHNGELEVLRRGEDRLLAFPSMPHIRLALLRNGGETGEVYLRSVPAEEVPERREQLFHVLRHLFLYYARQRGCFALHSASILYRGKAWLFSAPSGTGKSTQAALWGREYGVPQLNGDLGLLSLTEKGAAFHGMPWCGTSGISVPGTRPLGGIILLRQGRDNALESLTPEETQLRLMNRLISPAWTREQLEGNLAFAGALGERVPVWRYTCTKEAESARFLRGTIDAFLEGEAWGS